MITPRRLPSVLGTLALLVCLSWLPSLPAATAETGQDRPTPACRAGWVALTFDDGPDDRVTRRLVRILLRAKVPATFFMVGERVANAPAAARLVSRSGFQIANHSFRHADMTTQSTREIVRTLSLTQRALRRAGAEPTTLMRPPYGAINHRVDLTIRNAGYRPVLWDSDSLDWSGGSPAAIARRVLASMESRTNIVLQHDGILNSPNSVNAVPRIVRRARARGYCFTELDKTGRLSVSKPTVSVRSLEGREGQDAAVEVRLSHPAPYDTGVLLSTQNLPIRNLSNIPDLLWTQSPAGTALGGIDYEQHFAHLRFPAGQAQQIIRLAITPDEVDEPLESFLVNLSSPSGVTIEEASATVSIADARRPPAIAVDPAVVREPARGTASASIRIRLGRASGSQVRLTLVVEPRTAGLRDVRATRTEVTIPAGQLTTVVRVPVRADRQHEADERFAVRLVDVQNAWVFRGRTSVLVREAFSDR